MQSHTQVRVRDDEGHTRSRGRALCLEEFERLLLACRTVRPKDYEQWQRLLRGLWVAGLRLGEALILSWDEGAGFRLVLGETPIFDIKAAYQKSRRDQRASMTPEAAAFFAETPAENRQGLVLAPISPKTGKPYSSANVAKYLAKIGKKAGITTDAELGKAATAHDLRKSLGTRLAPKLPNRAALQEIMRHASYATTDAFYVGKDAERTYGYLKEMLGGVGLIQPEQPAESQEPQVQ